MIKTTKKTLYDYLILITTYSIMNLKYLPSPINAAQKKQLNSGLLIFITLYFSVSVLKTRDFSLKSHISVNQSLYFLKSLLYKSKWSKFILTFKVNSLQL